MQVHGRSPRSAISKICSSRRRQEAMASAARLPRTCSRWQRRVVGRVSTGTRGKQTRQPGASTTSSRQRTISSATAWSSPRGAFIPSVMGGDHVEGGVAVPFAIKLSEKVELEMMTEYDFIHDEEGSGYHVEYLNSGSLSYFLESAEPLRDMETGWIKLLGLHGVDERP